MAATTAEVSRGTSRLARIPLALIDTADNVRLSIEPAADAELAESIKAVGILQPVTLWETPLGRYQVRYGHRRVRAAQLAGLTEVPAIVSEDRAPETRVLEQLVENLQRADLSPLEEAQALRRMLDETPGLTQSALAEQVGRSRPWVSNTLGLLRLPDEVQALLRDGKLDASHAKAIAGLPANDQVRLATGAATNGTSAHTLEEQAKYARDRVADDAKRAKASEGAPARAIAALEQAGIAQGSTVYVSTPWNVSSEVAEAGVRAAGYVIATGWPDTRRWSSCDCVAWVVEVRDGDGSTVKPVCVDPKHHEAMEAERRALQQAKDQAAATARHELRGAILVSLEQQPIHPLVARVMLRAVESYSGRTWTDYLAMSDGAVAEALATRMVPAWDAGAKPLPMAQVIAALAGEASA
jgi:ParB family transcriptional regulator, chromosome partitioning protein